ncbi:putative guanine nucleotide exchange factor (GEF) [Tieghemostelium lacteum]|uniref:Putative guanine nucleotide exchange factor (GEF) n=1 Tax=Tieghemostelium lacteum TaxID=361077 RepID=A0A152A3V7_TIELA|nr:putative guanine nucleotide exchange factor (GEF) [Tieghemostelium lacteum]|eukprot:KYR00918.1 putative guanine nucleotide exchange factor (GEF) [Tieghemostelium lacteum]
MIENSTTTIENVQHQKEEQSQKKEMFKVNLEIVQEEQQQEQKLETKQSQEIAKEGANNAVSNFTLSNNVRTLREGNLIENFIVVGLPQDVVVNEGDKVSFDAKILYNFPPDKPCDPQVVGFCFPDGIKLIQVKRRRSLTDLNSVLFKSLSQLESSSSSFMFMITGGRELLYAVCVLNTEMINELPSFFPNSQEQQDHNPNDPNQQPQQQQPFCFFTSRCYCVISRFPYFKSHFDFLYSIIGKERLYRTNKLLQDMNSSSNSNSSNDISNSTNISKNSNSSNKSTLNQTSLVGVTPRKPIKPLPPLPTNNGFESPSETSPLFPSARSFPSETTSLLKQQHQQQQQLTNLNPLSIKSSISHSRSHSSPLSHLNLKSIQKLNGDQRPVPPTPPSDPLPLLPSTPNTTAISQPQSQLYNNNLNDSSSSPIHVFSEESLTAIQESLSPLNGTDIENFSDFSSPTSSANEIQLFDSLTSGFSKPPDSRTNSFSSLTFSPIPTGDNTIVLENQRVGGYTPTPSTQSPTIDMKKDSSPLQRKPLPKVPSASKLNVSEIPSSMVPKHTITNVRVKLEHQKSLLEEELECINYYTSLKVPKEKERLVLHFPGDQNQTQYDSGEDIQLIENWCLGGLIRTLSLKTILSTLSCVLLEKFLLITSKNIGLISNTIFALLPLLKPYVYQGAFIPILPYNTLDALYCPVPFVIGITKIPTDMPDALSNCYILDIDRDILIHGQNCQPITPLPNVDKLEAILKHYHSEVWKEKSRQYSLDYPFKSSTSDIKYIHSLSQEFKIYNNYIIETLAYYVNWNPNFDFGNAQQKEQLLKLILPHNSNFIRQFLTTQLFTSHTELLFESKSNTSRDTQLNHYKINKL